MRKNNYTLFVTLYIISLVTKASYLHAQFSSPVRHAIQISGSDNSTLLEGASSLYANPAHIRQHNVTWDMAISFDNRFNTDITSLSAACIREYEQSTFGLLLGRYGIDEYRHRQISISYSRSTGAQSSLGILIHHYSLFIDGLGQKSTNDISVGYRHSTPHKIEISTYIRNPLQGLIEHGSVNGKAELGLSYLLSGKLKLFSSFEKAWSEKLSFRSGFKYDPISKFYMIVALSTSPSLLSFGTGFKLLQKMSLDIGVHTHPLLGSSFAFSLSHRPE